MSDSAWSAYERLVARDWHTLSPGERRVVAIAELRTEVNNGGFDQYFFNTGGDHAETALEAAALVGTQPLVDVLGRA